jgi:hypothetical protein
MELGASDFRVEVAQQRLFFSRLTEVALRVKEAASAYAGDVLQSILINGHLNWDL